MDALSKLKQLLSSRYGKGLELRPLIDLSKLSEHRGTVVHGNDLYIPIQIEGQFLGTAVIPHGWELSDDHKRSVAQLVRMVLEPLLYTDFLDRRESNLKSLENLSFSKANISLFADDGSFMHPVEAAPKRTTTSMIHLYGSQAQIIKKVALQIHEISARWAFVPFEDVRQDLNEALDISQLGAMTLFIENIETLSERHQAILVEYMRSPRSLEEPLILTTSSKTLSDLNGLLVNSEVTRELQNTHLEVERTPLNSKTLREMVDLFFHLEDHQDLH